MANHGLIVIRHAEDLLSPKRAGCPIHRSLIAMGGKAKRSLARVPGSHIWQSHRQMWELRPRIVINPVAPPILVKPKCP